MTQILVAKTECDVQKDTTDNMIYTEDAHRITIVLTHVRCARDAAESVAILCISTQYRPDVRPGLHINEKKNTKKQLSL